MHYYCSLYKGTGTIVLHSVINLQQNAFFGKIFFIALVATTLHQSNGENIFKKLAHDIEHVADKFAHDVRRGFDDFGHDVKKGFDIFGHDLKKGFNDFGHDVKDAADDIDHIMKKFGGDVDRIVKDFESHVKDAIAKAEPFLKMAKIIVKDIALPLSEITDVAILIEMLMV